MNVYGSIYFYGKSHKLVNRTDFFKNLCKDKRVLHVGCADYPMTKQRIESGTLLHEEISKISKYCVGIDLSEEGIEELNSAGYDNVKRVDAESMSNLNEKFDIVLAADVVEHMCSPFLFLQNVSKNLSDDGLLIISVPSAFSIKILQYAFSNIEATHKDHCYYFSVKSLSELCSRANYYPYDLAYTTQIKDKYDSDIFIKMRDGFLKFMHKLSPYIIIVFKKNHDTNQEKKNVRFIYK